jgi:3-oxoadipate enol-lactonase
MSGTKNPPTPMRHATDALPVLPVRESGAGPPVVFLHGYPLDHRMWGTGVGGFLPHHRVLLVDLPGFGDARDLPSPESLEGFSEAVDHTLETRLVEPATIVGHSMGGYVALDLYRRHSGRFRALVLTNTRSQGDSPEGRTTRLAAATRLERPGEGIALDDTVRSLLAPHTFTTSSEVVATVRGIVASARPERLAPTLRALASRPDLTDVLPTIRVPTLVLWGASDQLIPPAQTRQMVGQIPRSTGVEITGAGHLPSLEAPAKFFGSLAEFLSRAD